MTLFRNAVFLAALSGLVAGIAMTVMQLTLTVPLILEAEKYETAAISAPAHAHALGHSAQAHTPDGAGAGGEAGHEEEAWAPEDGIERTLFTAGANIVTAIGFALLLVAASELVGGIADWRSGLLWGLAGFATFTLAPGLGLPPELPGMPAAELDGRQVWWIGTVLATAIGLALIVLQRSPLLAALGVALLIAPHLIGAPQPPTHETDVPANLHHSFVVAVTVTNLLFWVILGAATGAFRPLVIRQASAVRPSYA